MKDLFREQEFQRGKRIGCPICGPKPEKVALHRRVRRFLKQLLQREVEEEKLSKEEET